MTQTSKTKTVAVVMPTELVERINRYRRKKPELPGMSEAIRSLITEILDLMYDVVIDDDDDDDDNEPEDDNGNNDDNK